jgi:hypothetical protein
LVYGWNELQKIQYLQGELRKLKEAEIEDNEPGPLHVLSCGLAKDFAARIIQRAYRRRYLDKLHRVGWRRGS